MAGDAPCATAIIEKCYRRFDVSSREEVPYENFAAAAMFHSMRPMLCVYGNDGDKAIADRFLERFAGKWPELTVSVLLACAEKCKEFFDNDEEFSFLVALAEAAATVGECVLKRYTNAFDDLSDKSWSRERVLAFLAAKGKNLWQFIAYLESTFGPTMCWVTVLLSESLSCCFSSVLTD